MKKRLRKKRCRKFITTVCAYAASFDDDLRQRLLQSLPGTPFPIDCDADTRMKRIIGGGKLRYWATVASKLGPATATVVYWAEEFPTVRDSCVIFSMADLGIPMPAAP